jgi:hypothetical protein
VRACLLSVMSGGPLGGQNGAAAPLAGAAAFASFLAAGLTEMYLCNVCSCQKY